MVIFVENLWHSIRSMHWLSNLTDLEFIHPHSSQSSKHLFCHLIMVYIEKSECYIFYLIILDIGKSMKNKCRFIIQWLFWRIHSEAPIVEHNTCVTCFSVRCIHKRLAFLGQYPFMGITFILSQNGALPFNTLVRMASIMSSLYIVIVRIYLLFPPTRFCSSPLVHGACARPCLTGCTTDRFLPQIFLSFIIPLPFIFIIVILREIEDNWEPSPVCMNRI